MRVEFSKEFEKAARKLSGKMLESVRIACLLYTSDAADE